MLYSLCTPVFAAGVDAMTMGVASEDSMTGKAEPGVLQRGKAERNR